MKCPERGANLWAIGVLIVALPTEYEARDLVALLAHGQRETIAGVPCYRGALADTALLIIICGMGRVMAARRTRQVLTQVPGHTFILAGFAGALVPGLKKGRVLVADRYSPPTVLDRIRPIPGYDLAALHTANQVIARPDEKALLARQSGCQLVDMEMSAVAEVVNSHGLDILGIRVISDEAGETVPAALAHGYDQRAGRTTPVKMALHLLTHPWQIAKLQTFMSPLPAARRNLTQFVVAVVRELGER